MNIGGYQIIDLEDTNIVTNMSKTITGIYNKVKGTRKPILISGITINNTKYHDTFSVPTVVGSNFQFTFYGTTINISSQDIVTIVEEGGL